MSKNISAENEDFMPVSMPLTLEPGETVKCQHITLINDQTVEQIESFMVTLSRPPDLDPRIRLSLAQAEIFITDSDGKKFPLNIEPLPYSNNIISLWL